MRAIVFILFIGLVFLIVRFILNRIIEMRAQQHQAKQAQQKKAQDFNQDGRENPSMMVRCAQCGVHLPQAEAYFDGKDTFCSEGHMHQFQEAQAEQKK